MGFLSKVLGSVAGRSPARFDSDVGESVIDANLLFTGEFSRSDHDLVITGSDGQSVVVKNYFLTDTPVDLKADNGAILTGDVVAKLAGPMFPGQFAQNTASQTDAQGRSAIGKVETLAGEATAQRIDGTRVSLKVGDPVFEGDVVITANDGNLGITFIDGTVFSISSNARMVLDSLVYEPQGSSNSMLFNLVEGAFTFVTGQVAPTGDMKIETPVATMGIRGTTPSVTIDAEDGSVRFSILPDPGTAGETGIYQLFNKVTGELIATVSDTSTKWTVNPVSGTAFEVDKTSEDLLADQGFSDTINQIYSQAQASGGIPTSGDGEQNQTDPDQPNEQTPGQEGEQNAPDEAEEQTQEGASAEGEGEGEATGEAEGEGGEEGSNASEEGETNAASDGSENESGTSDASSSGTGTEVPSGAPSGNGGLGGGGGIGTTPDSGSTDLLNNATTDLSGGSAPESNESSSNDSSSTQPSNSAPTISLPAAPTVNEDGSVVVTGFSVADADGGSVSVGITAQSTVTLATTAGLTFSAGDGVADEVMAFTGTPAAVTAALNGLTYFPTADNDQTGGITIDVSDGETLTSVTLPVAIIALNDAPSATGNLTATVAEGGSVTLTTTDIGGSDVDDAAADLTFTVTGALSSGQLELNTAPGTPISNFTLADVQAGLVQYVHNGSATTTDSFNFSLADGGEDGATPDTGTFNFSITTVNDAPAGTDNTVTIAEDGSHTFAAADFGFSDPNDTPADSFQSVIITTLPNASDGILALNGTAVTAGQTIAVGDIPNLVFTAAADVNGNGLGGFGFQVIDDGGTANGGVNTDPSANTFDFNITSVNDEPLTTTANASGNEDGGTITVTLSGSDVDGSVASFTIKSLPVGGTLFQAGTSTALNIGDSVAVVGFNSATVDFVPDTNFSGTPTFTYAAVDNLGLEDSTPATATITVNAVNDAPVISFGFDPDLDALIVNDNHASAAGTNATQVLTADGVGGFTATDLSAGFSARNNDVKLADFDGDGDLDALTSSFQMLVNQGGAQGGTEGSFNEITILGSTSLTQGLAVGDLDGDGDLDAIAANWLFTSNQVLINQGGAQGGTLGNLVASGTALPGGATYSRDVALADVDDDGDLDAIIANDEQSANQLLINQGGTQGGTEGDFVVSGSFPTTNRVSLDVIFADVDGDGDQDAIVAHALDASTSANPIENELLLNDGSGNFSSSTLAGGAMRSTAIAAGDLDGDGDIDLVVANLGNEANQVLINQGGAQGGTEGAFVASNITGSDGHSQDVVLADVDGDGDLDAIITNNNFSTSADTNQLLTNDGTGNFTVTTLPGGGNASNAIAFGDLDGDATTPTATEDTPLALTGIQVTDVDASSTDTFTVTLSVNHGTITLSDSVASGVTAGQITGNGSSSVTVTAAFGAINTTLAHATGVTYQGDLNFSGTDQLRITANDQGATGSDPGITGTATSEQGYALIDIEVAPVSDAPEGADNTITINEDNSHIFTAADFGFSDPNNSPANNFTNVRIVSGSGSGSLTLNGSAVTAGQVISVADINLGLLVYTPAADLNGTGLSSYTFQVQDDGANPGETEDQTANTITFDVTPVNDAPTVSGPVAGTATEDGAVSFVNPLANASDIDGDLLSITNIQAVLPDGVTYTGGTGAGGTASGLAITNSNNITLANAQTEAGGDTSDNPDVTGGGAGQLIAYTATGDFSTAGPYGVGNLNDGDVGTGVSSDGTYAIATNGTPVTLNFGGTTTVGSIAIYNGYGNRVDGNYTLRDGSGTILGQWTISGTVTNDNSGVPSLWLTFDAPVTTDSLVLEFTTTEPLGGVPMTASFREIQVFSPQFALDPSDAAFQDLAVGETRNVTVNYEVSDGTDTTPTSISWTVTGTNDAPVLEPAITVQTIGEDLSTGIAVPAYFTLNNRANDPDSDDSASTLTYSFSGFSHPSAFTVTSTNVTLTPGADFQYLNDGDTANATVLVTATDSHGAVSNTSTLTWIVQGANDAPEATPSTSSGDEDTDIAVSLSGTDVDGTVVSATITTLPTVSEGVLYLQDGTTPVLTTTGYSPSQIANLVFKPAEDFNGTATISFKVADDNGVESAIVNEVITVNAVNDAPTIQTTQSAGQFGGTINDFVSVTSTSGVPSGDFALSFWVNDPTNENTTGTLPREHYVSYATSSVASNEIAISKDGNDGKLVIIFNNSASLFTGIDVPTDGNWHNFIITYTTATGDVELFLDGVSVFTGTNSVPGTLGPNGTLILGQDQDSLGGGFQEHQDLTGGLADVALFDGIPNAATISSIADGSINPTNAGVFLRWNSQTNSFEDVSGSNNTVATNGNVTETAGPPVVATIVANEDTAKTVTGIQVSDVDAGASNITVTLVVTSGTLDVSDSVSGGLIASDIANNGTGTVTLTGTLAAINATLADASGLTYQGNLNFSGTDTLTITADDGGATGSGGAQSTMATVDITVTPVNDAPTITVPVDVADALVHYTFDTGDVTATTIENTANVGTHEVTSVGFTSTTGVSGEAATFDVASNSTDSGLVQDELQTTLGNDSFTLSFWTEGQFSGTVLGNFSPNHGISSIRYGSIFMGGGGSGSATQGIATTGFQSTTEFTHLTYVFNVVPGANNDTLTTYQDGVLVGTTPLIGNNGTGSQIDWNFQTGASDDFAFGQRYIPGTSSLQFEPLVGTIDELRIFDGALTAGQVADIYAADQGAPDITLTTAEDTALNIAGISIADTDAGSSSITVTLSVASGALNVSDSVSGGLIASDIANNGSATVTLTGTLAAINATLADASGLTYQGNLNFNGTDTLTITADDGGATGSGGAQSTMATVDITVTPVNDAPTITAPGTNPSNIVLNGGFENSPDGSTSGGVTLVNSPDPSTINDWNVSSGSVDVISNLSVFQPVEGNRFIDLNGSTPGSISQTLTTEIGKTYVVSFLMSGDPFDGELPGSGVGNEQADVTVTAGSVASQSFSFINPVGATRANPGSELKSFSFTATSTSTVLTFTSDDLADNNSGPYIDDVQVQESGIATQEDTALNVVGISVADPDAGTSNVSVTLQVSNGTLTVSNSVAGGLLAGGIANNGTATVVLTGTLAAINATLADASGLTYQGNLNFNGSDTLTITANDGGATGSGGAQSTMATVDITVTPVDDGPAADVDLGDVVTGAATNISGFQFLGETTFDAAGTSVSGIGDINNDGIEDFAIGATTAGSSSSGTTHVIFGGQDFAALDAADGSTDGQLNLTNVANTSAGAAQIAGFELVGEAIGDQLGASIAFKGDVNGDGIADLIVGASNALSNQGTAYVVFGGQNFSSLTNGSGEINLSTIGTAGNLTGFQFTGGTAGGFLGTDVAAIGDINGDGIDDMLLGEPAPPSGSLRGISYVVYGGQDFSTLAGANGELDISTLSSAFEGFRFEGESTGNDAGISVAAAGDFDGDGIDDFLIGAPEADGNATDGGVAFLVYGGQDFDNYFSGTNPISLSTISVGGALRGFRVDGNNAVDIAGTTVAGVGDINNDGYDDIAVNAPLFDDTAGASNDEGASYIIFGNQPSLSGANLLSNVGGSINGIRFVGANSADSLSDVSAAGDINGDGIADLLISSNGIDDGANTGIGGTYVIYGGQAGLTGTINLSDVGVSINGFELRGEALNDGSGASVSAAGDVNGDGFDDLLVGAPGNDDGGSQSGAGYIIFGGDFTGSLTQIGTSGVDTLSGTSSVDTIVAGSGNDTINGNGGADTLRGNAGDDTITVTDTAFNLIDGGSGADILELDGAGLALDLSNLSNLKIQSIETLDITGSGNNTLNLSLEDVFDLSEIANPAYAAAATTAGITIDEVNTLFIAGDAGDIVNLGVPPGTHPESGGTWQANPTSVTINGQASTSYNYVSGGDILASVAIDTDVTTNIV